MDSLTVLDEKKTARLVALVEPSRMDIIEKLAKLPEFKVNGQPSNAAVVRAALDLFFAHLVRNSRQSIVLKTADEAPAPQPAA